VDHESHAEPRPQPRRARRRLVAWATSGGLLLGLGLALAVAPLDWIEESTGFEPDGGSGSLEWILVVVAVVAGLACLVRAASVARRSASSANTARRRGAARSPRDITAG
jgi:hypothetical protein